jgi:diacylglycerol kinase family enzyme
MISVGVDLSGLKVGAVINTSSGGCDADSEAEMRHIFKSAGVTNYKTWCGESHQMERAFAEAATEKPKMLAVLGGDGTIRTAAEACTGTDTSLLPLPGGTLNMLPSTNQVLQQSQQRRTKRLQCDLQTGASSKAQRVCF